MGNSGGKPVVLTDEVNLNHFRLLRVVGKGAFGKVRIVERKDTGLTFALKYIRKDEIVKSESVRNIIRERRMLQQLNHPFLCNLRYSFQDVEYLYIVVDLMNGGDLRFHITRKTFTEDAVRSWIAELACALRYIHTKGIVHRDVKPDNVLLDLDGHVHLADFNVASDFTPERRLTSKSGTLAYLAPEVYEGRGYTCEVDWWSLGVTFYECIYNKRPFEGSTQDSLKRRILEANPPYPLTNPPVSQLCLHAISSLLEKDKRKRIGAAGFRTFTEEPFFRAIDFEALERKEVEPIFRPSADKTNFDATYDLEELLLEEAPLEARARRQKPREQLKDDATQEEIRHEELHRMIEQLFEPFNYTTAAYDKAPLTLSNLAPTGASTETSHFASIPYDSTAPHIKFDKNTRGERDRDRDLLSKTRDRSGTEYSSARSTPVRSRSATHSPNGSPPLYGGAVAGYTTNNDRSAQHTPSQETYQMDYFGRSIQRDPQHDGRPTSVPPSRTRRPDGSGRATPEPPPPPPPPPPQLPPDQHNQYHYGTPMDWTPSAAAVHDRRPPKHRAGQSASMVRSSSTGGPFLELGDFAYGGGVAAAGGRGGAGGGGGGYHASSLSHKSSASAMPRLTPSSSFGPGGEGGDEKLASRPSGMLGFLNRKKGRDRSPRGGAEERAERSGKKGKERERGVLGKEGARVVVGHG